MHRSLSLASALAVSALLIPHAFAAADHIWNGTGNWAVDTGDWTTGGVSTIPTTGSIEIASGTVTYDPGSGIGGYNGDFRVDTVMTVDAGATFQQLQTNGAWMKIGDSFNSTLNVYGTYITSPGGTRFFAGNGAKGDINVYAGGSLQGLADLFVQNGSTVTANGTGAAMTFGSSPLQLQDGSVLVENNASATFNSVQQQNSDTTLTLDTSGTMTVNQGYNQIDGNVIVQGAGALSISQSYTQTSGNVTVQGNGKLQVANTYVQNGGAVTIQSGGSLKSTDFNQATGTTVVIDGGSLTTTGNVNQNSTTFTVKGGGSVSSNVFVQNSGTVAVQGGGTMNLSGGYNLNGGSLNISAGGAVTLAGGNLAINAGTTFSLAGAGSALTLSDVNAGELQLRAGSATMTGGTINARLLSFNNGDVPSATLEFTGGQINIARGDFFNGIFAIPGDEYVDFNGAPQQAIIFFANGTYASAQTLINNGTLRINGITSDISAFNVNYVQDVGVYVSVPEPTSIGLIGLSAVLGLRQTPNRIAILI